MNQNARFAPNSSPNTRNSHRRSAAQNRAVFAVVSSPIDSPKNTKPPSRTRSIRVIATAVLLSFGAISFDFAPHVLAAPLSSPNAITPNAVAKNAISPNPISSTRYSSARVSETRVGEVRIGDDSIQPLPPPPRPQSTPNRPNSSETNAPNSSNSEIVAPPLLPIKLAFADDLVSNATPLDLSGARARLADLARLLSLRDANALQLFGWKSTARPFSVVATPTVALTPTPRGSQTAPAKIASKTFAAMSPASVRIVVSRLAVTSSGALARITIEAPFADISPRRAAILATANANSGDINSASATNASISKSAAANAIPSNSNAPNVISSNALAPNAGSTFDIWLERRAGSDFVLTGEVWNRARSAAEFLSDEADAFWRQSSTRSGVVAPEKSGIADDSFADASASDSREFDAQRDDAATILAAAKPVIGGSDARNDGDIMDLVAEYRGGQWLPLRASVPWRGALLDSANLERAAATQSRAANAVDSVISSTRLAAQSVGNTTANRGGLRVREQAAAQFSATKSASLAPIFALPAWSARPWLQSQMQRYTRRAAGTAHFIFQRGARGWVGVASVFASAPEAGDATYNATENVARRARIQIDGADFVSATAHRDFALSLARVHLWNEAADEIAKANLMQANLVSDKQNRDFESKRVLDPQIQEAAQRDVMTRVGFAPEHPIVRVPLLLEDFRNNASPLTALRLGLEYSRLAYEREAADMLSYSDANAARFLSLPTTSAVDNAWFRVLREQLKARLMLASGKPANLIRSDLFSVRCLLNDPNAAQLLAGLEQAQYKIYSSFGVPMGNTEVILWSSQSQFQNYTTRQAGRNTSEFVTALTITQLVNADVGPVVLGEEINFYADARADSVSTIAHEYGHIAVRALAKGRNVPDWLNEGIATYTEGGYENYLRRVRNAQQSRKLLSMGALQEWNVDGDRAFLAYSQANSLVDFIVARWGNDAVLEILRQIGRDIPPNKALQNVLRVSPDGFYALWLKNGIK